MSKKVNIAYDVVIYIDMAITMVISICITIAIAVQHH